MNSTPHDDPTAEPVRDGVREWLRDAEARRRLPRRPDGREELQARLDALRARPTGEGSGL